MSAYHPTLLLITSLTCLGFAPSAEGRGLITQTYAKANSLTPVQVRDAINSNIAQIPRHLSVRASSGNATDWLTLTSDGEDPEVSAGHSLLQPLSHNGTMDADFSGGQQTTVSRLSTAAGFHANSGIANTTEDYLEIAQDRQKENNSNPDSNPEKSSPKKKKRIIRKDMLWVLLLGFGTLTFAGIFAGAFYLLTRSGHQREDLESEEIMDRASSPYPLPSPNKVSKDSDLSSHTMPPTHHSNGYSDTAVKISEKIQPHENTSPQPTEGLDLPESSALAKIDAVDRSLEQLQSQSPTQRRKAIWELGQTGDSRAIQPLVNLLVDSDSKQRSLILAAISEIGSRTLHPMNRALAVSLQDRNPEVRKNAIRDLTRIYELLSQTSQLLSHALEDSDPEVQEAAKWALSQLGRIRTLPNSKNRTPLQNWTAPTDNYPEDIP